MKRTTPRYKSEERGPRRDLTEIKVLNYSRQPSKFTETVPHQIYVLATLGLTQPQMAAALGIGLSTLENWLQHRETVRAAYEDGKYESDLEVELALRRKALGYEYERTREYSGVDSLGREWSRSVTEMVRVEGDIAAQKFWLSNRGPERWREHSNGSNGTNIQVNNIDMGAFSEDEKALARSMAIKQLEGTNVIAGN